MAPPDQPLLRRIAAAQNLTAGERAVGSFYEGALPGAAFMNLREVCEASGVSTALDISSAARLVAVCPAMVLVPGPHLLNGALDIAARRITLGLARLTYGSLIVLAISAGLILGLLAAGPLPVTAVGRSVPLWLDVPAAMVAAASYPIYFSLDLRFIMWPVLVGGLAHAARWLTISGLGGGMVAGGFVACLITGLLLAPMARRMQVSFAGVGFAAVVCLVPGMYIFRCMAGLLDLTTHPSSAIVTGVAADLSTGALTLIAMAVGLILGHGLTWHLRRTIAAPPKQA